MKFSEGHSLSDGKSEICQSVFVSVTKSIASSRYRSMCHASISLLHFNLPLVFHCDDTEHFIFRKCRLFVSSGECLGTKKKKVVFGICATTWTSPICILTCRRNEKKKRKPIDVISSSLDEKCKTIAFPMLYFQCNLFTCDPDFQPFLTFYGGRIF